MISTGPPDAIDEYVGWWPESSASSGAPISAVTSSVIRLLSYKLGWTSNVAKLVLLRAEATLSSGRELMIWEVMYSEMPKKYPKWSWECVVSLPDTWTWSGCISWKGADKTGGGNQIFQEFRFLEECHCHVLNRIKSKTLLWPKNFLFRLNQREFWSRQG